MTIPEIRDELHYLADQTGMLRLHFLADQTWRRSAGRHTRAKARKITPELIDLVWLFAQRNPSLSEFEIGVRFGINQGRVSEILFGFRGRGES